MKIKYAIKCLMGRDLWLRPRLERNISFLGSQYGGWGVDLEALPPQPIVYSCGVGEDASFDVALIKELGCQIYAYDPTPKSLEWVRNNISDDRFIVHPWALSGEDGELELWLPNNTDHVSASFAESETKSEHSFIAEAKTVKTLMEHFGHEKVDILKMDIEGSEYSVIETMCHDGTVDKMGQILIEFHHWQSSFSHKDTCKVVDQLKSRGFEIAWVSDSGHEVLFARA